MIFTKADASTSDEQVENLNREFNIHYRYFIGSLIDFYLQRVDLSFALHRLENISSKPGKVHFEVLVHLLRYIRDNNTLGLKYYADMKSAPVSNLFIQAIINTENQLIELSDSSWQDCPDTGRSKGAYIVFYQGGPIDHGTNVPEPVAQSSSESDYNAAYTVGMALTHFRMLINELLNKDPDIF